MDIIYKSFCYYSNDGRLYDRRSGKYGIKWKLIYNATTSVAKLKSGKLVRKLELYRGVYVVNWCKRNEEREKFRTFSIKWDCCMLKDDEPFKCRFLIANGPTSFRSTFSTLQPKWSRKCECCTKSSDYEILEVVNWVFVWVHRWKEYYSIRLALREWLSINYTLILRWNNRRFFATKKKFVWILTLKRFHKWCSFTADAV